MVAGKNELKQRVVIAAMIMVLAITPILLTLFPPVTDLPQHIAQVRLLMQSLNNPNSPYAIQWAGPNNLIYAIIFLLWRVLPVGVVAQATMIVIVLAWVASIQALALRLDKPLEGAALASMLVFNHALYWGFLNFLVGFPIFIGWVILTTRKAERTKWGYYLMLAGMSFLLYEAHALWFAVGVLWLFVTSIMQKPKIGEVLTRIATLVPVGLLALLWYPSLSATRAASGFDVAPHWMPVFDRLSFSSFVDGTLGGLKGSIEPFIFLFLYAWVALSIWQNRGRLRESVDKAMLSAAGLFLLIFVLAPDKYMNTIFFASRWLPIVLIFLLLGLPAPKAKPAIVRVIALSVTITFFLITSLNWFTFETAETSGLRASLKLIPGPSRVLGLDFVKQSEYIKGSPFLQMFAYAQVYSGGELNFSFAEHASGLVAYKAKRAITWTPGLEWYAELVKKSDLESFDFVLVNGDEPAHRYILSFGGLDALTISGRWRLYRVHKTDTTRQ